MDSYQPGILQPLPEQAVYLTCSLGQAANLQQVTRILQNLDTDNLVVAIGQSLLDRFNQSVPGLRAMPAFASEHIGAAAAIDLWCWIRGDDRGKILHRARRMIRQLGPVFDLVDTTDAFQYASGKDLTGYEDGTENPVGEAAFKAQLNRMTGADDGIEDGLFQFSRVLNSAYYWCPPVKQGKLNLAAIDQ